MTLPFLFINQFTRFTTLFLDVSFSDAHEVKRLLKIGLTVTAISKKMKCHRNTVYNTMKKEGLTPTAFKYSEISNDNLTEMIRGYNRDHPNAGELALLTVTVQLYFNK